MECLWVSVSVLEALGNRFEENNFFQKLADFASRFDSPTGAHHGHPDTRWTREHVSLQVQKTVCKLRLSRLQESAGSETVKILKGFIRGFLLFQNERSPGAGKAAIYKLFSAPVSSRVPASTWHLGDRDERR